MKLLVCLECQDVFKLQKGRYCICGKTTGEYKADGLNAIYSGPCKPIGFMNSSLVTAMKNQPQSGLGTHFTAFVIPVECPTFTKTH